MQEAEKQIYSHERYYLSEGKEGMSAKIQRELIAELTLEKRTVPGLLFEDCTVSGCRFIDTDLYGSLFADCIFEDCVFEDSLFEDCRIIKTEFPAGSFRNVTFTRCDLSRASFIRAKGRGVSVNDCDDKDCGISAIL